MPQTIKSIIIIGAGAAGVFAAIHNKLNNPKANVIIIEKSATVLAKVKISGGGRCNVTHACFDPKQLVEHYPRGKKELLSCFHKFQPQDTINWFTAEGVKLKTEADNRIFPTSDKSQTIIDCLLTKLHQLNIPIHTKTDVTTIKKQKNKFNLTLGNNTTITCDKLILATGSAAQGYALAKSLGHSIIHPIPSLFTFKINDKNLHKLSGLAVKNVTVELIKQKKSAQTGPLLITHWGLSGPSIIKLSAIHAKSLYEKNYTTDIIINWLPNLTKNDIETLLNTTKQQSPTKLIRSQSPFNTLPNRLWHYLTTKANLNTQQSWATLQKKQILALINQLQHCSLLINGKGVFKEEFVTCGGVALNEINFKTMQSTKHNNLHIIGELLDIDGLTGGFNFQNAWTTAFLSAKTD